MSLDDARKMIPAAAALGAGPVLKALGKFLPGIGSFVSGAYTAGYAADQILDFVKDKLENPGERRNRQQLQSRAEQGIARSDEEAALTQMEQNKSPANALIGLGKLGAQAAGGMASARVGAEQQAQEQAIQQQKVDQQKVQFEAQQQHQAQQDQLASIRQQQSDIRHKENMEFRKRSEERAIEDHKKRIKKYDEKNSKAANAKAPSTYLDALVHTEDWVNRAP